MNDIEQVATLLVASAVEAMILDIAHPIVIVFIRDPNDNDEIIVSSTCISQSTIDLMLDAIKNMIPNRCTYEEKKLKTLEGVVSELLKNVKRV